MEGRTVGDFYFRLLPSGNLAVYYMFVDRTFGCYWHLVGYYYTQEGRFSGVEGFSPEWFYKEIGDYPLSPLF